MCTHNFIEWWHHFLINIFYKNKELRLDFGDHVTVINDFLYENGGSTQISFSIETELVNGGLTAVIR
jgi:hypothetical protein